MKYSQDGAPETEVLSETGKIVQNNCVCIKSLSTMWSKEIEKKITE